MNTGTCTLNGRAYDQQEIARAKNRMGYLVWMKLPSEYFSYTNLTELLESNLSHNIDPSIKELQKAKEQVFETILGLQSRRIKNIRLGLSWAEGETLGGWAWISWYLQRFHEAGFDILPNINYTPYVFAKARLEKEMRQATGEKLKKLEEISPTTNIPPEPLSALRDFAVRAVEELGEYFGDTVELWNEPELNTDWHPDLDPNFTSFVEMIKLASTEIRARGKKVLLGGPSKFNSEWFDKVGPLGLFDYVDIVGIHGLRGTWSDKVRRPSWQQRIESLKALMKKHTDRNIPVWLTEVGFTTIDLNQEIPEIELEEIQVAIFADLLLVLADGHADRVYWYTLFDLVHESVRFLTTGWEDILQFYFGDTTVAGGEKLLAELLIEHGVIGVLEYVEQYQLWELKDRVIDRGDPALWKGEKLQQLMEELENKARQSRDRKAA